MRAAWQFSAHGDPRERSTGSGKAKLSSRGSRVVESSSSTPVQRGRIGRQRAHGARRGQMLLHAALVGLQPVQLFLQSLQPAAAFLLPAWVAFKLQVAVPGLHGVHHLAAVFHDQRFVEQHHRVVGGQFVGAAQIVKSRGAIILAAGGASALEVGRRRRPSAGSASRAGSQQAVENIDGGDRTSLPAGPRAPPTGASAGHWDSAPACARSAPAPPAAVAARGPIAPPRRCACGVTGVNAAPGMRRSKMRSCV